MTFEKSYEIMKSNFSYSCPMVIQPLINLANCLLDLHKFDEALSYYKKVLRMFEKNSSMEATIQNVSFLYNMSIAAENCRFFNESFSIMSEAIDLVLSFLPKNHPSVIKVTERIKYLQHKYGQIGGYWSYYFPNYLILFLFTYLYFKSCSLSELLFISFM